MDTLTRSQTNLKINRAKFSSFQNLSCHGLPPSRKHSTSHRTLSNQRRVVSSVAYRSKVDPCMSNSINRFVASQTFWDNVKAKLRKAIELSSVSLLACLISASILVCPVQAYDDDEGLTITFPSSGNEEIALVQKALVQSWGIVQQTFWDPSFDSEKWMKKLEAALVETFHVENAETAYGSVRKMLGSLEDPYTRLVPPKEYATFRISNDGAVQGVGLLIATEPSTGRLIVLTPIEGGPADRAGIHPGDELVEIDNEDITGISGTQAANLLRGKAGTSVSLTLKRSPDDGDQEEVTQIVLKRESISLSPVFFALLEHPNLDGENLKTGYIRLSSFSQNAAEYMESAIQQLLRRGADNFILDLRNNPGGLVTAGIEVAEQWLDGSKVVVNTVDRSGVIMPLVLHHGDALTQKPLAVLVNGGSASASEILAGALHDNGRAILVGEKTYGKGKIQSVFELDDGSALFVTVAQYFSPALEQIDKVGIAPDSQCTIPGAFVEPVPTLPVPNSSWLELSLTAQLERDPCIQTAEMLLPPKM